MPDTETLLKCLDLQWKDHIQTRGQTWRTLQIEAALAIALVGIDWQLGNIFATIAFAILLIIATYFGSQITLYHRNVTEIRSFSIIINIEKKLGMLESDLLGDVQIPKSIKRSDAFRFKKSNTSLFILRMHITLQAFAIIYLIVTLFKYFRNQGV